MFDCNKLLSFSHGHILVKSFCASAFLIIIAEEEWFTFFDGSAFENAGVLLWKQLVLAESFREKGERAGCQSNY